MDDITGAIAALKPLLGERLSTAEAVRDAHGRDEAYGTPCPPDAVAFPENTAEVAEVVRICAAHRCPVIPFGVGTSLEGHVIPARGGISIDTSRMNSVLRVNERDLDAVVQPGVTRMQLNNALRATGLMFTVDPGADATMGGMAATRASGTNTVRYGTMRENVLALEVVMPDGAIVRTGGRARKSSAGYDLTHLMIGSEGTLGIITELTVKLHGIPEEVASATCAFPSVEAAVDAVILAIQAGLPMARIELLDALQMTAMNRYNEAMELPEVPHLFLEFHGTTAGVAEQVDLMRAIVDEHGGQGFAWATRQEDRNRLWKARHEAYYAGRALRPGATAVVTDCCVPISALSACIAETQEEVASSGLIAPLVGHVGDGNFHLLVLVEPGNRAEIAQARALAASVNEIALRHGGTITGEHGVGSGKLDYMAAEHGGALSVMAAIKRALDPHDIMNPGKVVPLN